MPGYHYGKKSKGMKKGKSTAKKAKRGTRRGK